MRQKPREDYVCVEEFWTGLFMRRPVQQDVALGKLTGSSFPNWLSVPPRDSSGTFSAVWP